MEEGPKDSHNLPHLPSPQQPPSHTASHRQDSPPHPPKLDQKDHTPRNHPPPPAPKIHDLLRQRRPPLTTPGISIQCGGKESTASNMTQNSEPWTPPHTTPPTHPPNQTAEQPQLAQSGAPHPKRDSKEPNSPSKQEPQLYRSITNSVHTRTLSRQYLAYGG
jgi:hypothetical protein